VRWDRWASAGEALASLSRVAFFAVSSEKRSDSVKSTNGTQHHPHYLTALCSAAGVGEEPPSAAVSELLDRLNHEFEVLQRSL
jgi:hypothetical protein